MCKTDYGGGGGGGGGSKNVLKIDYVICERPLMRKKSSEINSMPILQKESPFDNIVGMHIIIACAIRAPL